MKFFTYYKFSLIGVHLTTEADDRRTIKSADFITRFYWPIPLAGEKIRTSSTAKFITEISGDKIGRVTYKSWPIFRRLIKSADFIVRLSPA